jgi:hypothetical protein
MNLHRSLHHSPIAGVHGISRSRQALAELEPWRCTITPPLAPSPDNTPYSRGFRGEYPILSHGCLPHKQCLQVQPRVTVEMGDAVYATQLCIGFTRQNRSCCIRFGSLPCWVEGVDSLEIAFRNPDDRQEKDVLFLICTACSTYYLQGQTLSKYRSKFEHDAAVTVSLAQSRDIDQNLPVVDVVNAIVTQ